MNIPVFDDSKKFLFNFHLPKNSIEKIKFLDWKYALLKPHLEKFEKMLIKENLPYPENISFIDKNDAEAGIILLFGNFLQNNFLNICYNNEIFEFPISNRVKNAINGFRSFHLNFTKNLLKDINKYLLENKIPKVSYFHFSYGKELRLFTESVHDPSFLMEGVYIYEKLVKDFSIEYNDDFGQNHKSALTCELKNYKNKEVNMIKINIEGKEINLSYKSVSKLYEMLDNSLPLVPFGDDEWYPEGFLPFEY